MLITRTLVGQDGILPPIENRPASLGIYADFQSAAGYQPAPHQEGS
jgi:hypothetical protein